MQPLAGGLADPRVVVFLTRAALGLVTTRAGLLRTFSGHQNQRPSNAAVDPTDQPDDDVIMRLIKRGQREGSFAPELSATWIEDSLFGLLLKGCEDAGSGEFPRHTVAPLIIRTFECGICPLH